MPDKNDPETSINDDSIRRQWRRIAKEGRNFLCHTLSDKCGPEKSRELYQAVNQIRADKAQHYDWEHIIRETLPEPILDIMAEPKWSWLELFNQPEKNPVVKIILNEYEASRGMQDLIAFAWIPPVKNGKEESGGGSLVCLCTSTDWAEKTFRSVLRAGIPDSETGIPRNHIYLALWNNKNLISPQT